MTILNRDIMSVTFSCKCPYNGQRKVDRRQLPPCSFAINICLDFLWKTNLGQKWKSSSCLPFVRASKWVMFCPKSGRVCLSQVHFPWFTSARALGYHTLINDISWCWTSWTVESRRDGKNAAGRWEFSVILSSMIFVGAGEKSTKRYSLSYSDQWI